MSPDEPREMGITEGEMLWDREEVDDLKEEINKLLWVKLPEKTTLGEAEEIANHIYQVIVTAKIPSHEE